MNCGYVQDIKACVHSYHVQYIFIQYFSQKEADFGCVSNTLCNASSDLESSNLNLGG